MKDYYIIAIYFTIIVVCIFGYGIYRCKSKNYDSKNDPLMKKLGIFDLDGWSITHLITFLVAGYFYPDKKNIFIIVGVVWEFVEYFLGTKLGRNFVIGVGDCSISTDPKELWWYGRVTDVIINIFGLYLGIYLKNRKLG